METLLRMEVVDGSDFDLDFPGIHFDRARATHDAKYRESIISETQDHARNLIERWCEGVG